MKIDRRKIAIRCGYDEPECKALADRLAAIKDDDQLIEEISKIRVWTYGKCELGLWADILDRFDSILEEAVRLESNSRWTLNLDSSEGAHLVNCVIKVLEFTGHLIEHSIYRYMYGSLDHVIKLFNSSNLDVVLSVLGLFYTFSKRSNYFARLENSKKHEVASRLEVLAESWGGKENNFGLRECCSQVQWPKSASTLHFEYYDESPPETTNAGTDGGKSTSIDRGTQGSLLRTIHLENLHLSDESPHRLMEGILKNHQVPESKRVALFARLRLARYFSMKTFRAQCLKARLQAISILCYNFDAETRILYRELMEELVDVLELPDDEYRDMKASVMRTLTAIVHSGKRYYTLDSMMETTGMNTYPGVVPSMVHRCVQDLVDGRMEAPSGSMNQQFTTALLSFLYHLACFEEQETYPMSTGGTYRSSLATGYLIDAMLRLISWRMPRPDYLTFATRAVRVTDQILNGTGQQHRMPILSALVGRLQHEVQANPIGQYAILSRSALMKSIINLIKRIIAESDWATVVTTMMENSRIPDVVLAIIKRPNDFPAPLYLNSLELITNYIYQNPSRLSALQEKGLTSQVIEVLHEHPLPVSREVLISLAQVLSMLVLNDTGASAIIRSGVIEKFLNCLVDEAYLPAMKLRRMRDNSGQTSTPHQMGYTLDELIRCHTMMRMPCVSAMVAILQSLVDKGGRLSEDIAAYTKAIQSTNDTSGGAKITERRRQFMEMTFNVLKFFESFLSTHGSQQHMPDLLREPAMPLLLSLIQLPCLPLDFQSTPAGNLLGVFMRSLGTVNSATTANTAENSVTESGTEFVWNRLLKALADVIENIEPIIHEENFSDLLNCSDPVGMQWPPRSRLVDGYVADKGESRLLKHLSVVATVLSVIHSMSTQVTRDQRLILVRLWHGERGNHLCSRLRALMNSLTLELGMLVHYLLDKPQREHHQAWTALQEMHNSLPQSTVNIQPLSSIQNVGDQTKPSSSSVGEDLRQPILTSDPGPERLALYIASSLMSDGLHMVFGIFRSFFVLQNKEVINRLGDKSSQPTTVTPEERVLAHMIILCSRSLHLASNVCSGLARLAVGNLNFTTFRRRQANSTNPPVEQCTVVASHIGNLLNRGLSYRLPYKIVQSSSIQQPMETDQPQSTMMAATSSRSSVKIDSWQSELQLKLNFTLSFFSLRLVTLLLCEQPKVPYHILLNAFQLSCGHDSLFDIFNDLFGRQWEDWCNLEERTDMKLMGMQFLERWLVCVERFTNNEFLSTEGDPPGSGVLDDITRCPSFKVDSFVKHTHGRFLSVLKTLFSTTPTQTISMLSPKAQECLVTIMLHMARRAKKLQTNLTVVAPKTDTPGVATSISLNTANVTPVTATANSLAAALQSAGGLMSTGSSVLGSVTTNDQLLAAMEAVVSASRSVVDAAQRVAVTTESISRPQTATPVPMPTPATVPIIASTLAPTSSDQEEQSHRQSDGEHVTEDLVDSAASGQSSSERGGGGGVPTSVTATSGAERRAEVGGRVGGQDNNTQHVDELAQLMDMFPSIPRELVVSALEECRGDLQEATETLLLTSSLPNPLSPRNEIIPSPPPPPLLPPPLPSLTGEITEVPPQRVETEDVTVTQLSEFLSSCLRLTRGKSNKQVCLLISELYSILGQDESLLKQIFSDLVTSETPQASYNYFVALQFTRNRFTALELACSYSIPRRMIQVLEKATVKGADGRSASNHVTSACLILDQVERTQPALSVRRDAIRLLLGCREWRIMDDKSLRWTTMSNNANRSMSAAFHDGIIQHRYMDGRRQESANFVTMSRLSNSSVSRRPIQPWTPILCAADVEVNATAATSEPTSYEQRLIDSPELSGLNQANRDSLFLQLVTFVVNRPSSCDWRSLDAVLRLLLRLASRDYNYASQLADLHVYESLLTSQVETEYAEYTNMVALLLRQIFEDPAMIEDCITDILRHAVRVGLESKGGDMQMVYKPPYQFDMLYIISQLGPLFAREFNTTVRVATERLSLQVDSSWIEEGAADKLVENMKCKFILRNQLLDDSKHRVDPTIPGPSVLTSSAPQVTSVPQRPKPTLSARQKGVLQWLLDHLVKPDAGGDSGMKVSDPPPPDVSLPLEPAGEQMPELEGEDLSSCTDADESHGTPVEENIPTDHDLGMDTSDPEAVPRLLESTEGDAKKSPITGTTTSPTPKRQLGKGEFFLFLTELVRSYAPVAEFVVSYQCNPESSEYNGSALACLIDRYLMDPRLSELTGNLIGWLVRSVHCSEAQSTTVNEIKSALRRALDMVECRRKHELLQAIAKLLDKIVSPLLTHAVNVYNNISSHITGRSDLGSHQTSNMLLTSVLRALYKKQIGRDLARVPVALDMNSPRAIETTVRVVKTLETLTRINKINTANSAPGGNTTHRRRHPAQHYLSQLTTNDPGSFRNASRRIRTLVRTATAGLIDSIVESTASGNSRRRVNDGVNDFISPILDGLTGDGNIQSGTVSQRSQNSDLPRPNSEAAEQNTQSEASLRLGDDADGSTTANSDRPNTDEHGDEGNLLETGGGLVNEILGDEEEDEDIMVDGDVAVSIFSREQVDDSTDHVMLEADDDGEAAPVSGYDDGDDDDDDDDEDDEDEDDDDVEDVQDDVVDADGEDLEEDDDDDSDSDSDCSDEEGRSGDEPGDHYRAGDGDDDDEDFDDDDNEVMAADGMVFQVPISNVGGEVVVSGEHSASFSFGNASSGRHYRSSSIMEAAEIRNFLEVADISSSSQRNGTDNGNLNMERVLELLNTERYEDSAPRQNVFLPQYQVIGGVASSSGNAPNSFFNLSRGGGESSQQQANRLPAYISLSSQHESLRHTTDSGGGSGSGSGGTLGSGGVGSSSGTNSRNTGGFAGNAIYRWPNRAFGLLPSTSYESMINSHIQMGGRGNNQPDPSSDPLAAQEGDVAMWEHLKEQETAGGGSVTISNLERPSLPPLTYRRWLELARVLYGREISDLIILGREKIVPILIKRRNTDFQKAVNEKIAEKEKEKARLIQEKETEEKRLQEINRTISTLTTQDARGIGWNTILPNGSLTENQQQILKRQIELLSEIGYLRERGETRRTLTVEERHSLRYRLRREGDPFFMRTLAICFLPVNETANRQTSIELLRCACRVIRVILRKTSVDSSLTNRFDESLFMLGLVNEPSDLKLADDFDLSSSNIHMLLSPPMDFEVANSENEGLSALLRLVSHQLQTQPAEANVPISADQDAEESQMSAPPPPPEMPETSPADENARIDTSGVLTNPAAVEVNAPSSGTDVTETPTPNVETINSGDDTDVTTEPSAPAVAEASGEGLLHRVDPSFLSALPDDLRREVIADEVRSGLRQHMASRASGETPVISEQFLSALPGHIQEEVNAQFRRVTANLTPTPAAENNENGAPTQPAPTSSATASAPAAAAVVATDIQEAPAPSLTRNESATFLDTLSPELRRDVLTDMDDSQIAALPQAVANEARQLRMENEQRTVRMYQERAYHQAMTAQRFLPSTRVLHSSDFDGFRQITRQMRNLFPSMVVQSPRQYGSSVMRSKTPRESLLLKSKQFVDQEGLTCLLSLLIRGYSPAASVRPFEFNQPTTSGTAGPARQMVLCTTVRRLLRNLAYHAPTRYWLLRALLSILHSAAAATWSSGRTSSETEMENETIDSEGEAPMDVEMSLNSLLTMSYPVALGCRVPFFTVVASDLRRSGDLVDEARSQEKEVVSGLQMSERHEVRIHPRVAVFVCKTMLDTLADMGQYFYEALYPNPPSKSVPDSVLEVSSPKGMEVDSTSSNEETPCFPNPTCDSGLAKETMESLAPPTEFWRLLLRLDRTSVTSPIVALSTNPTSGGTSTGSASPVKNAETPVNQSSPPDCAFVSVASLLLHNGLYLRQELPESILMLLDEILNKFKAHTDSRRLMTGSSTTNSSRQQQQERRQGDNPLYNWLINTNDVTNANRPNTTSSSENTENPSRQETQDATDIAHQQQQNESVEPSEPPQQAQTSESLLPESQSSSQDKPAADSSSKTADLMETLPKRLIKRITEVLLYSPINEYVMRRALNLVKSLSRLNSMNRVHLFEYLMEGLVVLAAQLTRSLDNLIEDLIKDNAKRKREKQEQAATGAEAMETDSPSTSVVITSSESQSTDSSRNATTAATRVMSRFQNGETVVIVGDRQPQALTSDLQLVSLVPFTTKGSTQNRFVKILTLINSIRPEDSESRGESPQSLLSCISMEGQAKMDRLWEQLSKTLTLLEESADPQAVLLLQPSVEAFFLTHAKPKLLQQSRQNQRLQPSSDSSRGQMASGSSNSEASRPSDQLAHLNLEVGPVSPPSASGSCETTSTTSNQDTKPGSCLFQSYVKGGAKDPLFRFAERHRTVLNQILRQQSNALVDGPFSQLINHPKVLDFDVKRNYIHNVLLAEHNNASQSRDEEIVQVNRARVFEDSFARLHRKSAAEWKNKFYIIFANEEGQDAGGLLREWYQILARETFNPNYALFCHSAGDKNVYTINPSSYINSNHLTYFKFVGRVMAKAIYDQQLLECYFTRSFYKHILGIPVKCSDMENEDVDFHKSLVYMLENDVSQLDLTFTTEVNEFGRNEVRELVENGSQIRVNDQNKSDYVRLVCQEKMTGAIRQQLNAFLEGFYDIIPKSLISIFNEQELELLISGLPNIDVDDLLANTEYNKYTSTSVEIQWFWRALRSFEQEDRARFLQFVTGTSKVPLGGFSNLYVMHGPQKFQIHKDTRGTDRLPTAHTCFNQLDLPPYETYDRLRNMLLTAIRECSEGFGFA